VYQRRSGSNVTQMSKSLPSPPAGKGSQRPDPLPLVPGSALRIPSALCARLL